MLTNTPMVLLVDDDAFILDMLRAQLLGMGYDRVICAANGTQAVAQLLAHGSQIGAIVFDLTMPDMDGMALIERLAQRACTAGIILLSGAHTHQLHYAAQQVRSRHLNLLGVLGKPCATWQLHTLLLGLHQPAAVGANDAPELAPRRLTQALANGELVAWYQPVLACASAQVLALEAQVQWPGLVGGLREPQRLVPALAAAGLNDELFLALARQAARDLATWRRQQLAIKVALTLSMATARYAALAERLQHSLSTAGDCASDIRCQVAERDLAADTVASLKGLSALAELGLSFSLDDFGMGHLHPAQLVTLPIQQIKIAASLVQCASADASALAVVQQAVALGQSQGWQVVAKGVQTQAQLELVRRLGCDGAQGDGWGAPMSGAACTARLLQDSAVAPVPRSASDADKSDA